MSSDITFYADYENIRFMARQAAQQYTQADLAEKLDVNPSSLSKALSTAGARYFQLQCRILEVVAPHIQIDPEPHFKVVKKPV